MTNDRDRRTDQWENAKLTKNFSTQNLQNLIFYRGQFNPNIICASRKIKIN